MAALKNIGSIQLFAEIQNGSVHTVYKGYQTSLERFVLVKTLKPEFTGDTELVNRFIGEARFIAKIQHPNVVAVFESGELDNQHYFAAEFIDGFDLRQILTKKKLPPELASYILLETVNGLKAAHDNDILHQDIKPSNILISHEGQVKLTDFGMAGLRPTEDDTPPDSVSGTLPYFSPEQILGEKPDKYSDIFSLGSTLFEMLTGNQAFSGETGRDFFEAIVSHDPIPFLQGKPDMPSAFIGLCEKMLKKNKTGRYQNCDELITDLTVIQETCRMKLDAANLKSYLEKPETYQSLDFKTESRTAKVRPVQTSKNGKLIFRAAAFIVLIVSLAVYNIFFSAAFKSPIPQTSITENKNSTTDFPRDSTQNPLTPLAENAIKQPPVDNSINGALKPKIEKTTQAQTTAREAKQNNQTPARNRSGYLNISVTPWAQIFIDGDSIGTTPLNREVKLSSGKHVIKLVNPEFPVVEKSVIIAANSTQLFEILLWSEICELKLDISPWADVYIDGVHKDTVPPQERPIILFPGKHKLALVHPNLGRWETEIVAKAGEPLDLQFNLNTLLKN